MDAAETFGALLAQGPALRAGLQVEEADLDDQGHGGHHGVDGGSLPLWSVIPFVGILLSIAIAPLVAEHFWHHHYGKVSLAWALIFCIPYLIVFRDKGVYDILHIYLLDYIPFIVLLWGLYTVAGGILVRGTLRGTPTVNTLILLHIHC